MKPLPPKSLPKVNCHAYILIALMTLLFFVFEIYSRGNYLTNSNFTANARRDTPPMRSFNIKVQLGNQTRKLWPTDEKCRKFDVQFGHNLRLTYLASFPRSGNTWTRYLIEAATGIFTGSVYGSKGMYRLGFLGEKVEPKSGKVIVVKTHGDFKGSYAKGFFPASCTVPVILLLRNVEKSTLSHWNFKQKLLLRNRKNSVYITKEFRDIAKVENYRWLKMNEEVLVKCRNIMVIFYENLLKDPMSEVERILQFLHFEADEERLECLRKHIEGPAKTKHKHNDTFNKEEKKNFIDSMRGIVKLLEKKGFAPPVEYYDYIKEERE